MSIHIPGDPFDRLARKIISGKKSKNHGWLGWFVETVEPKEGKFGG